MKTSNLIFLLPLLLLLGSCSCNPEGLIKFAAKGMESMIGEGFLPSDEIRQLGDFQSMSVNLSTNKTDDNVESTIFLKLENGDPLILGNQPEVLARKCAEIYLRDFENSDNYKQITVQFLQGDPTNPENFAMQEYTFETSDF
ncbi:MAG: hypothetical protein P8O16_19450 [Algoriphagus sp.]|jgi:hypothetical protein|uniref:hypothetical protein n=1 Tax=Algoriphagus sp. TaxID=1872435 RepID=UPI002626BEE1|nr:hypothetical protein [Algoriphagus sp.]MDG1279457.1 hypothetical protein [Algoriphagus sp.]